MREFLYLLMSAIATGSLFQGEDTRKVPIHSVMELEKGTFVCIGSMFAVSLLYGGPSPCFLAPPVADYLTYGIQKVKVEPCDIPDREIREKILNVSKIHNCSLIMPQCTCVCALERIQRTYTKEGHQIILTKLKLLPLMYHFELADIMLSQYHFVPVKS